MPNIGARALVAVASDESTGVLYFALAVAGHCLIFRYRFSGSDGGGHTLHQFRPHDLFILPRLRLSGICTGHIQLDVVL